MDASTQAGAEVIRRKVRRASGHLREAAQELAQLVDGVDAVGVLRVHDQATLEAAQELVALNAARHDVIDVVVLRRS